MKNPKPPGSIRVLCYNSYKEGAPGYTFMVVTTDIDCVAELTMSRSAPQQVKYQICKRGWKKVNITRYRLIESWTLPDFYPGQHTLHYFNLNDYLMNEKAYFYATFEVNGQPSPSTSIIFTNLV